MPTLSLSFLGPPRIELDGQTVEIPTRKAVALLVYLAVTGQPQSRERLAALFWPESDTEHARGALRAALAALRRSLGDGWITTEGDVLSLRLGGRDQEAGGRGQEIAPVSQSSGLRHTSVPQSAGLRRGDEEGAGRVELDVVHFHAELAAARGHAHAANTVCPAYQARLAAAADLYRGELLAGFALPDCRDFEEWLFFEAEGLRRDLADVLQRLAASHTAGGELERALAAARRWLALDALHEPAHRALMRLYALADQRAAALRQYEECARVLAAEVGGPPSQETRALYEEIRAGHIRPLITSAWPAEAEPAPTTRLPAFLRETAAESPRPLFVARERELARLHAFLDTACQGRGQVTFVTGEAGAGKSSLLGEFLRQALDRHGDLLAAAGTCSALGGQGDPYLPFRQAFGMLSGDLAGRLASGAISPAQARRLWEALPEALNALLQYAPALAGILLPLPALLDRAEQALPADDLRLARLCQLAARAEDAAGATPAAPLFSQATGFLTGLAESGPLLVVLDDLQWADAGSINLLFHLARSLTSARVLILGAYRPEEVELNGPQAHPLGKALAEIKRLYGDTWLELDTLVPETGRAFVDAYLDATPNMLDPAFRAALHAHTGGHALFTAEILRQMREQGLLIQDSQQRWMEGGVIDWSALPPRVEGVIQERLARLPEPLRELLAAASVEGEDFTAQVVARALAADERGVLRSLERELGRIHRLVRWQGAVPAGERNLDRFRFGHALFQQHCYTALGAVERRLLHGDIAAAMEACYGKTAEELAAQLGWHWEQAGEGAKAIPYLLAAGDRARLTYANTAAIGFYERALALLKAQGDEEGAARALMRLGLVHSAAADYRQAEQAYNAGFTAWRLAAAQSERAARLPLAPHPLHALWYPNMKIESLCSPAAMLRYQLFAGLVEESPTLEVVPDVAAGWEIAANGCIYTFHLRHDAHWSDGTPVTADDFVYAWQRGMAPGVPDENADLFDDIRGARAFHRGQLTNPDDLGVTAAGPHTLIVELARPAAYFLHVVALPIAMPQPRHLPGEGCLFRDAAGRFVSNGPFVVEAICPDELLVLTRNPAYSGRSTGNLERIEIDQRFLPSQWQQAIEMFCSDRLEAFNIFNYPPEAFALVQRSQIGETVLGPIIGSGAMAFDVTHAPFDDIRVRRALQRGIDRASQTQRFTEGRPTSFPALGGLVPPGLPGHTPGIAPGFDPAEARRLLAEAGYPGGRDFPEVVFLAETTPGAEHSMQLLNEQILQDLGIALKAQFLPGIEYLERSGAAAKPLAPTSWFARIPRYPDPDDVLRVGAQRLWRMVGRRHAEYDRLVEAARTLRDHTERMALYRRAEEILIHEAFIVPRIYWRPYILLKPWVKQYALTPVGAVIWKDVIIEPH